MVENALPFSYYQKNLDIDIDLLHKCCANQSVLYQEIGEAVAELRFKFKSAKLNFEEKQATLDLNIRFRPEDYNITKITENTIKSVIETDSEIKEEKTKLLVLEKELERWTNLLTAYDQRRSMLKAEVVLFQANYWGDVSISEDKKLSREHNEKVIEKMGAKKSGKSKEE